MKILGKTIIVTGAANGIGREITLQLLNKGAHVIALEISMKALVELVDAAAEKGSNLTTYVVDITDREAIGQTRNKIIQKFQSVDGVINNAGIIQPFVKLNELSYEVIEKVMNVNFWGCLNITKAFLPDLIKQKEAHLVNVSSMGGFLPVPGQTIYGAAKASVKLMTEGLAQELKDTNVKVSVVFPGAVATNIMKNSGIENAPKMETSGKASMVLSPKSAAAQIIKGIEKNKAMNFVGKDSKIMDCLYRISSGFASNLVGKQMKKLLE